MPREGGPLSFTPRDSYLHDQRYPKENQTYRPVGTSVLPLIDFGQDRHENGCYRDNQRVSARPSQISASILVRTNSGETNMAHSPASLPFGNPDPG
jgi:hypothetical protein